MNEKVKWKLAFKNLEKQTKMNVLIFLQLAILLLICMSCVSVFFSTYPNFRGAERLSQGDGELLFAYGLIDSSTGEIIQDSRMLEERLPGNHFISSYSIWGSARREGKPLDFTMKGYDQEIIDAYEPRMQEGRWLGTPKKGEILHAVVTSDAYGLKTGDRIQLYPEPYEEGMGVLEVEIQGVLSENTYLPGYNIVVGEDTDFRWAYTSIRKEYRDLPIFVISRQELEMVKEYTGNPETAAQISDLVWRQEEPEMGDSQRKAQKDAMKMMGFEEMIDFPTLMDNSRRTLMEENLQLLPVFLIALFMVLLSELSTGSINARLQMHRYGIYQLCGLRRAGCIGIHIRSSLFLAVLSLAAAWAAAWWMGNITVTTGGTVMYLDVPQIFTSATISLVNLLFASWIQGRMIRKKSVSEILRYE